MGKRGLKSLSDVCPQPLTVTASVSGAKQRFMRPGGPNNGDIVDYNDDDDNNSYNDDDDDNDYSDDDDDNDKEKCPLRLP